MKIRTTIIRHGKTQGNIVRCYSGCRTDEPLTDEGRNALCAVFGENEEDPAEVFVSPMIRTKETSGILFPGAEQVIVPEIREMDFGSFEGKTHAELSEYPEYQTWLDSGGALKIPEGESLYLFRERVMDGFRKIVREAVQGGRLNAADNQSNIYIVAHGGTIMGVMNALTGKNYYDFWVDNGCGYTIDLEVDDAGNIIAAGSYDSFRGGVRAGSSDR